LLPHTHSQTCLHTTPACYYTGIALLCLPACCSYLLLPTACFYRDMPARALLNTSMHFTTAFLRADAPTTARLPFACCRYCTDAPRAATPPPTSLLPHRLSRVAPRLPSPPPHCYPAATTHALALLRLLLFAGTVHTAFAVPLFLYIYGCVATYTIFGVRITPFAHHATPTHNAGGRRGYGIRWTGAAAHHIAPTRMPHCWRKAYHGRRAARAHQDIYLPIDAPSSA